MFRLVAYSPNGVRRFSLDRDKVLLGSDSGCDIALPFSGVGNHHAQLVRGADGFYSIEDLGTRRGILVNGERIKTARLQVLDEIRIGTIALLLEDVMPEVVAPDTCETAEDPPAVILTPERMLHHLARVSGWVLSDASSSTALETLMVEMLEDAGGGVVFLFQGDLESLSIKFVVATTARWLGHGDEILQQILERHGGVLSKPGGEIESMEGSLDGRKAWMASRSLSALERDYLFVAVFPQLGTTHWRPLAGLRTLADQLILGLVHHVGQYEPIIFGRKHVQQDLTLAPGLVTGESRSTKRVLESLRAAVPLELPVLLRGESGISKELLARSLHLSSSRASGPFIVAQCGGAAPNVVEADLFGAEIAGRTERLVREGKLLLANHGTLYLEDVEQLDLRVQDRLMRFLRSREVEPVDSLRSTTIDVRLVTSSSIPLESSVAKDLFRVDLAYRLSQLVIDVPSIRERREDIPLLIQAAVNRCCHQSGKRVQGITVKAMEALTTHEYPGNLPELEGIVRRLVYLCPNGRPIDETMLPQEIRLSKIRPPRANAESDLHLESLLSECERAAIREALRRSDGNKSEAARLLGLSRNGLAMKMTRLAPELLPRPR